MEYKKGHNKAKEGEFVRRKDSPNGTKIIG